MRCAPGACAVLLSVLAWGCDAGREEPPAPAPRVAVCGEEMARAVVALGVWPRVVGADTASLSRWPSGVAADLGFGCNEAPGRAVSLGVDVVLLDGKDPERVARLAAAGVAPLVFAPVALNDVLEANRRLGAVFAAESRARVRNAEIARGSSDIAQRRDGSVRLRVAWVLEAADPEGWVVVGGLGVLHELIELAGAENAFHTPPIARHPVSAAELSGADLVLNGAGVPGLEVVTESREVPAELGHLPILDPLPRLEALYRLIYPETE